MKISPLQAGVIHFVGIGGIGMSGIAQLLHNIGYQVQGSDLSHNANITAMSNKGIKIFDNHQCDNIKAASLVVTSSAIDLQTNEEVIAARNAKIPVIKRAEMLSEIMRLRSCIAIAGTHGKTTTTCLTATLLEYWGIDPTVINGGIMNAYGTNTRLGSGEWMVVEADESDGSFLKLPADISVITNIEMEHADFYASDKDLIDCFKQFIENIPFYGLGIICNDDEKARAVAANVNDRKILTYGIDHAADLQATNIKMMDGKMIFDIIMAKDALQRIHYRYKLLQHDLVLNDICLPAIGRHNILNALAAIGVAISLGMPKEIIIEGLKQFQGVKRRFSIIKKIDAISIIDDYAHHPTEIAAVYNSAKLYREQRVERLIVGVFQPHRYSRLQHLFNDFVKNLSQFDKIFIAPVYSAGEDAIKDINADSLAQAINKYSNSNKAQAINNLSHLQTQLGNDNDNIDQIVFMGAGDITKWANAFI